jgi:hypothetical protein
MGHVIIAARRVLGALIAVFRQIVAIVKAEAGEWPKSSSDRASRPGRGSSVGRIIGLLFALVANVAAVVLVFALARAIYYPFWAAGASTAELERSWGGPSAVGATLVHWIVAAITIAVMYVLILLTERLAEQRRR